MLIAELNWIILSGLRIQDDLAPFQIQSSFPKLYRSMEDNLHVPECRRGISYSNIWEEEFLIMKYFQGIRTRVSDRLSNNEISCSGWREIERGIIGISDGLQYRR